MTSRSVGAAGSLLGGQFERIQQASTRVYRLLVSSARPTGRLAKLLNAIPMLFIIYMELKMLVFMILQGLHIKLQANHQAVLAAPPSLSHPSTGQLDQIDDLRSQSFEQLKLHRLLMRQAGVAFRDLGPAAMLGYATLFIAILCFVLSDLITFGYISDTYKRDDFFIAYRDHKLGVEKINEAYDGYLRKLIQLNSYKMRIIARGGNFLTLTPDEANEMKFGLHHQQSHLNKLITDKRSIMPPNYLESWIIRRQKFAKRTIMIGMVAVYLSSVPIAFMAAHFSNDILEQKGETPMSFGDILSIVEFYFAIYLALERALPHLIWLTINFKDKSLQLDFIQQKFERLKMIFIELKQARHSFEEQLLPLGLHRRSILAQNLHQLKLDCDREALEVYLCLRVFIDLLRSTTRVADLLVDMCCIEMGFFLVVALFSSNNPETYQLIFIFATGLFLLSTVNAVLIVCASFGLTCVKTTHQAWSLVANFTRDECIIVNDEDHNGAVNSTKMKHLFHLRSMRIPAVITAKGGSSAGGEHQPKFERMRGNHIGTDTEALWRRFVADMPTLHKNFSCKVLGFITLNYNEMVHLNFWFLSVVLIFFTHRKH